jgi:hypothetical protein
MFPPAHSPRKISPEQQLREIEDDETSQFLWDLMPKVATILRRLNQPFSTPQSEVKHQPVTDC